MNAAVPSHASSSALPASASADETLPLAAFVGLAVASVGLRLALLGVNLAEYTDGILQLTLFTKGNPYWPPLYSLLAIGAGSVVGDLELGGKIISATVGGLGVIPVALIGQRIGGARAAAWAGLFYLVLPEGLRWGVRVMTDAAFLALFSASLCLLMPAPRRPASARRLAWGSALAVAAAMVRYQGVMLLAPIVWEILRRRRARHSLGLVMTVQALWFALPLWMFRGGFAHLDQILTRRGADIGLTTGQTLLAYLNLAECYLYLFPYSLTPPIFLAFLAGIFAPRSEGRPARWLLGAFLWSGAFLLAAQAAFGIFEFRYLLPLAVFVLPFAGVGMARLDSLLRDRRPLALPLYALAAGVPLLFSLASIIFQREAFADIKQASVFAAQAAGPGARLFTNERYNDRIPVAKVDFWADREVFEDPEAPRYFLWRQSGGASLPPSVPRERAFREGDLLILSSLYAGGPEVLADYLRFLSFEWRWTEAGRFQGTIIPLLPDLMSIRGAHGSPLWWLFRYQRQDWMTLVIRIEGEA